MKISVEQNTPVLENLKVNFLGVSVEKQLELAHIDYEKRKNEIISKLYTIWQNIEIPAVYRNWIRKAARFINEREI